MSDEPQSSDVYDAAFSSGGYEGVYDLPYRHSTYFPLYRTVLGELRRHHARRVLEIGCGTGAFAHMLVEKTAMSYRGIDFSPVAVAKATQRVGRPDLFQVGDALDPKCYAAEYDAIVCTEVLEHVERDIDVIRGWRSGALCICSVPNYDSATHVRHFHSAAEVRARYSELIEIEVVREIRKPFLSDNSWQNRLRELRWNRHRPKRFLMILGIGRPADFGTWFVFVGRKR